jgi:hypothetical protein
MLTPPLLTLILRIESKRCELNVGGQRVYEMEMLLDPVAAGSPFFDRPTIERLIAQCEQSRKEEASLLLRQEYNAAHRYAIGTDTGKCNGNDYSTSVLIDFSTISAGQVGSYANNRIPADQFAYELKRQADLFGSCPIAPEKNSEKRRAVPHDAQDDLRHQPTEPAGVPLDRLSDQPLGSRELGWETNGATKDSILNDLRTPVEKRRKCASCK